MSSIRLSQLEKQSLVLALSPSSSPSGPLALKRTGRTHGRRYLLSVLRDVFRSSRFESERFEGLVQPLATSPSVFGTPCNVYSTHSGDDCGSEILTNTAAPLFTQPTTVRNLAQIEVCERLTSDSAALLAAIDNVGGVGADRKVAPLTADKLEAIQLLFDPDRRPTREEKAIAEELLKRLAVPTVNEIDRWRLLIQLSCEQPGWTVL